jgi:hypothetical protein
VLDPGDGTRRLLCQKPTAPHTATASHTIAAYISPMVVSPITETVVFVVSISRIDYICLLTNYAEMLDMPQPLYIKKLQAARLHLNHIKCCYMPQLLYAEKLQAACMQLRSMLPYTRECCSSRCEGKKTDKTRHEGPEGALLFLRATSQVQCHDYAVSG